MFGWQRLGSYWFQTKRGKYGNGPGCRPCKKNQVPGSQSGTAWRYRHEEGCVAWRYTAWVFWVMGAGLASWGAKLPASGLDDGVINLWVARLKSGAQQRWGRTSFFEIPLLDSSASSRREAPVVQIFFARSYRQ